ncbi:MAG: 6-phosphofructokinase [bacterium]
MKRRRIGILTGGGDCPGLNAVIRGVTKTAILQYNMDVVGFFDGFLGLMENRYTFLTYEDVSDILTRGGTILGTNNKANPFQHVVIRNGTRIVDDVSDTTMGHYRDLGLEALIAVGGDGTMTIAGMLAEKGAAIIGIPKTIDKDLVETDTTFGFDTARQIATEGIDRLHTTAESHHRVMVVEVMGRNAGWLALEAGIAGGGDIILLPELPYHMDEIIRVVRKRAGKGKRFSIVVASEGARPEGGAPVIQRIVEDSHERVRLGGISHFIAEKIEDLTSIECRVTILGHLQRGGTPSALDRFLATRFAVKGMELAAQGDYNRMVALKGDEITCVPLAEVAGRQRLVPPDSPVIKAGLSVGTSFGVPMT